MRAHIGTRDGRKGSAPLGSNYFLASWETDKNVYGNGLVTLKLGPFLDIGKITDSSTALGSHKLLWDVGAQTKLRIFGRHRCVFLRKRPSFWKQRLLCSAVSIEHLLMANPEAIINCC
jgi:hypothetical protein